MDLGSVHLIQPWDSERKRLASQRLRSTFAGQRDFARSARSAARGRNVDHEDLSAFHEPGEEGPRSILPQVQMGAMYKGFAAIACMAHRQNLKTQVAES